MTVAASRGGRACLGLLLAAQAAGLLAPGAIPPAEAAFPGANGVIAFASNRTSGKGVDNPTGDSELFTMNQDGSGLFQITDNTTHDGAPAWSADGQLLAYSNGGEIYLRNFRFIIPVTRRLTTNTVTDSHPSFSPDGTKIAFQTNRDGDNNEIYVMETTDNDKDNNADIQTRLTNDAAFDAQPAWSPDGTRIAFVREGDGDSEIFVMDADGSDLVNLTNGAGLDLEPNWSPDGSTIVFMRHQDNNYDIYMMRADGSEQKRLTKKAARDAEPVWSPDGTKIAFTSTRGGGDEEIYVMKAKPESRKNRPKNRTTNGVDDFLPDWRPIP